MKESIESTSGMNFTPLFEKKQFISFYIEDSDFYKKAQGIDSVEFVTIENDVAYFIEAKSSIPRERDEYYSELYSKFYHSLILLVASELRTGKFTNHTLPTKLQGLFHHRKVTFVLIIPTIPNEHLPKVREEIEKYFRSYNDALELIWGIDVIVLNEDKARIRQLIM